MHGRPWKCRRREFPCLVCQKVMATSEALHLHLRRHSGEKFYRCSSCNFSTNVVKRLNFHVTRKHKRKIQKSERESASVPEISPKMCPQPKNKRKIAKKESEAKRMEEEEKRITVGSGEGREKEATAIQEEAIAEVTVTTHGVSENVVSTQTVAMGKSEEF
ncbi:hypothetical protein Pmani_008904 [Petrolisthes manimaculis]|uniref:C2H2-type domain-containing protein n=1 Tax=Petrolisthes manimaculis TaxID=1843537 RepID=A0AAE1Q5E6_9EUCA|nr:hypothetical protein Pmani_008904 [Petrolisthes manimaculis]